MSLPATENAVDTAARYGSGVPARLKLHDLSYIEMTGVPRRFSGRSVVETLEMPLHQPGAPPVFAPMHADALFQALIDDLERAAASPTARQRPPGATQALAEAESLLQALDRDPPLRRGNMKAE